MFKKLLGILSLLLSGAWWLGLIKHGIEHFLWGRALSFLDPYLDRISLGDAFQYGPPAALAIVGAWLLWPKKRPPEKGERKFDEVQVHSTSPIAQPDITVALNNDAARVGDYRAVCSIVVTNTGARELDRCQVQITTLSGVKPDGMHLPFTLRTIEQIAGSKSGRFMLSKGQSITIPVLVFREQRKNEWFFFDENGKGFFVSANPIELSIRIYGGADPVETPLFVQTDAGSNPFPVLTQAPRFPEVAAIDCEPLEIIFDPTNPGRKFWSIEPMKAEDGKQTAGSFWEYRAIIKNRSAKTVRNVKVVVEAIGVMPTRPEPSQFDINKKHLIDLTPNEEQLVLIRRWYNPPIVAGMAIGEGIYGPIKMTASADDIFPTTKFFQFDPMQTPMIFELKMQEPNHGWSDPTL
jgi:hypothetical protein